MLFIWPQLLKIWPQLSRDWPQLYSFGEKDGNNFFRLSRNTAALTIMCDTPGSSLRDSTEIKRSTVRFAISDSVYVIISVSHKCNKFPIFWC